MPRGLTPRSSIVLVSLAFSVTFALQALGGSEAAQRPARPPVAARPGPKPDLSLAAARSLPALKNPRVPHVRKPKPKTRHVVVRAPTPAPARVAATPVPTPKPKPKPRPVAPRYVPTPAPRYVAPRYVAPQRTPAPTPKATPV